MARSRVMSGPSSIATNREYMEGASQLERSVAKTTKLSCKFQAVILKSGGAQVASPGPPVLDTHSWGRNPKRGTIGVSSISRSKNQLTPVSPHVKIRRPCHNLVRAQDSGKLSAARSLRPFEQFGCDLITTSDDSVKVWDALSGELRKEIDGDVMRPLLFTSISSCAEPGPEDVPLAVEKRGGSVYQFYTTSTSVPDGRPRIVSVRPNRTWRVWSPSSLIACDAVPGESPWLGWLKQGP
jgi:hypothetical protein